MPKLNISSIYLPVKYIHYTDNNYFDPHKWPTLETIGLKKLFMPKLNISPIYLSPLKYIHYADNNSTLNI